MCYLAEYHPETKSFGLSRGRKLRGDQFYAVVHTGGQSYQRIPPVSCYYQVKEWQSLPYTLGNQPKGACLQCLEIMDSAFGT